MNRFLYYLVCCFKHKNAKYSYKFPRWQQFTLPISVISSMLQNPSSPKGLAKLFQTCKYFFGKRPIYIMDEVEVFMKTANVKGKRPVIISFGRISGQLNTSHKSHKEISAWLTGTLSIVDYENELQDFPKCYRYSIEKLSFSMCKIKFANVVLFASEKQIRDFDANCDADIYHEDKSRASIDEILEHLPNIDSFGYFMDDRCSAEMLTKLIKMKFNHKFQKLLLNVYVHETFDLNLFCEFVMKNVTADTELIMSFYPTKNLEIALQKLDPKWEEDAHKELQKKFFEADPNWRKEKMIG